ncbi:1-phosphofructokinase [Pullulanibacillus pueri]|uniref:Tagatose-6-phosphate kinase n=1 Tax=Pullulanibacillus pueri TaxID=1437324 RepID=A0A8J2ZU50_9BACL|nr:1-phosphofructokinase [Pullulanibacillus pueri]MBM7681367.1 1-phosphofructokinase [Pullulanibacillus pueri]GGH78602.1 1-phosphofructokinase [Pullulanibacillus pueri]
MIYTCTLNPSIDYFIEVEDFKLGGLNRIDKEIKVPGGKGINVSRVLNRFGVENKALGFTGGFTGQYIMDCLTEEDISTDFVKVDGDSRINIKLRSGRETEMNGRGPEISEHALRTFMSKLEVLEAGDILVLSGSIPDSLPKTLYELIIKKFSEMDIKVVVDATGQQLLHVLPYHPFLIKPNHVELGEVFDVRIQTVEDAIPYGQKLVDRGAENVIVSMGEKGNLLFTKMGIYYANIPEGQLKNSVGAGDSVVAGFIASYVKQGDIVKAFQFGATAGSASAYAEGFCTPETIDELIDQVQITEL